MSSPRPSCESLIRPTSVAAEADAASGNPFVDDDDDSAADAVHYTAFPPLPGDRDGRAGGVVVLVGGRRRTGREGGCGGGGGKHGLWGFRNVDDERTGHHRTPTPRGDGGGDSGVVATATATIEGGPRKEDPQQPLLLFRGLTETLHKLAMWMHQAHADLQQGRHQQTSSSSAAAAALPSSRHVFVGDQHGVMLPVVPDDATTTTTTTTTRKPCDREKRTGRPKDPDEALLFDSYPSLELTVPGSGCSGSDSDAAREHRDHHENEDENDDDDSATTSSSMSLSSSDEEGEEDSDDSSSEEDGASRYHHNDSDYFGDMEQGTSSDDDEGADCGAPKGGKIIASDLTSTSFSSGDDDDEEKEEDNDDDEEEEIYRLANLYRQRHGIAAWPSSSMAKAIPTSRRPSRLQGRQASWEFGGGPCEAVRAPPRSSTTQQQQQQQGHRRRQRRQRRCRPTKAPATRSTLPQARSNLHQRLIAAGTPPTCRTAAPALQPRWLLPEGQPRRPHDDHSYLYISDPDDSDDVGVDDHHHHHRHRDQGGHGANSTPSAWNEDGGATQIEFLTRHPGGHPHHPTKKQPTGHSPPQACFWPALATWFQRPAVVQPALLVVVPPPTSTTTTTPPMPP